MQLININSADVTLYEAGTDKEIGSFAISQLNTSFTLNGIPTCTAMLTSGTPIGADSSPDYKEILTQVIAIHASSGIRLSAQITLQQNKKIKIFEGVVTSISLTTVIAPYGNSRDGLIVNAYHKYAQLYRVGSNGMVYKEPSGIRRGSSLSSLIKLLNANTKNDENSTNNMMPTVVRSVLETHTKKEAAGSGSKNNSSIAVITKSLVDAMYKNKILDGSSVDISDYIEGSTAIDGSVVSVPIAKSFTKEYLERLWGSVSMSSVGSAILTLLNNREFLLTLAPRSVDKLTILPEDGITIHKDHPTITPSMYNSIHYNVPNDVHPDPEGVLVTRQGSEMMSGGSGTYGTIIGAYPKIAANGSTAPIRWAYVKAPGWLADNSSVESDTKDTKARAITTGEYTELCDKYAEWLYRSHVHKNNTITLSTDARMIDAIKALGSVCEIETEAYGDIKGLLFSYTLTFTQTAQQSNLSINLHFSHVEAYIKEDTNTKLKGLYTIDDSDIVKEFPDTVTTNWGV